jgi:hypothetical protein
MLKRKLPTKDEVFAALKEELDEYGVIIAGNISAFKVELHKSFKKFLGKQPYKDKHLYEFVFMAVDDLLEEELPSQVSDCAPEARATK